MQEALYRRLIELARLQSVTRYADVAPSVGFDVANQEDRTEIGRMLGEISTFEHQQGHPLLSAVVIHQDNNMPGQGFFTLARELHVYNGEDDFLFFVQELRRVHDFWRNH